MEPPNCTAQVTADRAELWLGTQAPDAALLMAAKIAGLSPSNVFVHNCFEGGGFGMGGCHGELEQAVTIAKALNGRPVKVLWTREEDMAHVNGYHPMGVAKLTAALGAGRHADRAPDPRRGQRCAGIHAGAGDDPRYVPGQSADRVRPEQGAPRASIAARLPSVPLRRSEPARSKSTR